MKSRISDIATVQVGYSFRSRLEPSKKGRVAVIQMKDLSDNNMVNCRDLVCVDMDSVKERHLTQKGDLVFRSRGHATTAAVLLEDPGKAVVAAPLLRIRVKNQDKVLPEYLNWYISQRDAQVFLTSKADGTAQKTISKQVIEALEIPLPSLKKQKSIVELAMLSARERSILYLLANKREQNISAQLMKFAKGE